MKNIASKVSVAAVIATALFANSNAFAQSKARGFAIDRFDPSERGSDWFTSESLDFRGHGRVAAGAIGDYNHDALVTRSSNGLNDHSIVSDQLVLNLGGNVVLWDRWRLGLNVPVAAYATGDDASSTTQSYSQPKSTALGDTRVSTDVRVFGQYGDAITGAVGVALHLPTGQQTAYMSDGTFRVSPRAMVAGKISFFEWSARTAFAFRDQHTVIQGHGVQSEVELGGAAGVRFWNERILVGPEVMSGIGTDFSKKTDQLEAMLGVHGKVTDSIRVAAGAGAGLTTGFGTPGYRMTVGLEWAPNFDPGRPAPVQNVEKQPDPLPAPPAVEAKVEPAPAPAPEPVAAAPADRDNDGVLDAEDECPDDPGPKERKGCPLALVHDNRIIITDQIKFRTGSAVIDPVSDPILIAVDEVLVKHPEINVVRIEGHTDTQGNARMNVQLSKDRAAAVVKWLVGHSIESNRLKSEGYGASQPIASNASEDGRRENRRVEFHIVEGSHASR